MGGGNGQKAKMAREKNLEKAKGAKGKIIILCSSQSIFFFSFVFCLFAENLTENTRY
jgi:hypothetical protein